MEKMKWDTTEHTESYANKKMSQRASETPELADKLLRIITRNF